MRAIYLLLLTLTCLIIFSGCNIEYNPPFGADCNNGKYWLTKTISLSGGTTQEWPWNGGYKYNIPNTEKVRIYMWNDAGDECIEVYRKNITFLRSKERYCYVEITDGKITVYQ